MRKQIKNYSRILFFGLLGLSLNVQAQHAWNPKAPMNPTPLKYSSSHYGLKGPVKTVDNLKFDQQGFISEETGIDGKVYTYSKTGIEESTNEYTFQYKYEKTGQIVTMSIAESRYNSTYSYDDNGNLISVLEVDGPNQMEVLYSYDDQNRLISHSTVYGEDTLTRTYEYYEEVDSLEITEVVGDDKSSKTIYVYKEGSLDNYEQMGAMQREDIKYDSHGNWIEYFNPISDETETRTITYY